MKVHTIISEDSGETLSLGRLAFWIIFGFSTFFWFYLPVTAFPDTLFYTLSFLMVYNISKKSLKSLDKVLQMWVDKKLERISISEGKGIDKGIQDAIDEVRDPIK